MTKKKTKKKKATTKLAKVEEVKELKKSLIEGKDAVVLINIFAPGHEAKEFKVRIPKIIHNSPIPQRDPAYIAGMMIGALKRKYGGKVA